MLVVTDIKTDNSDDIIIKGDILIDDSDSGSSLRVAERRIVARGDDFLLEDVAAGLETYLFKSKTPFTSENIKTAINDVLLANRLFTPSDFSINIIDSDNRTLYITLIFTNEIANEDDRFRIVVDIENQRVYRG